jgi:hypothetical protein
MHREWPFVAGQVCLSVAQVCLYHVFVLGLGRSQLECARSCAVRGIREGGVGAA